MIILGLVLIGAGQFAMMVGSLCGVAMHDDAANRPGSWTRNRAVRKAVLTTLAGFAIFALGLLLCLSGVTHA